MKKSFLTSTIKAAKSHAESAIGNRRSAILLLAAFASLHFWVQARADSSPFLIPYQGRLTDPNGVPYTNGQYTLAFNLYDQPIGGSNLWSETHYKVGVINGMVNVFLGSINPALSNVVFSQTRHLGITIYADNNPNNPAPEMVPRQIIIPAFWAKNSENSEKLAGYDWTPIFGANNPTLPLPLNKIPTITSNQIAPQTITSNQIVAGSIDPSDLVRGSVGTLQLAIGGVAQSNLAPRQTGTNVVGPGGVAISLDTGNVTYNVGSAAVDVTNLTVTITTTGRPVFVGLMGTYKPGLASLIQVGSTAPSGVGYVMVNATLSFLRGAQVVDQSQLGAFSQPISAGYSIAVTACPSSYHAIDTTVPAGTYTYNVQCWPVGPQAFIWFNYVRLVAYEL